MPKQCMSCILRNVLEASVQTQIAILLQQANYQNISCLGFFLFSLFLLPWSEGSWAHNVVHLNLVDLVHERLLLLQRGMAYCGQENIFLLFRAGSSGETGAVTPAGSPPI